MVAHFTMRTYGVKGVVRIFSWGGGARFPEDLKKNMFCPLPPICFLVKNPKTIKSNNNSLKENLKKLLL